MRKVREVLRLQDLGLNVSQIARSCDVARSTVNEYLDRAQAAGLGWPVPDDWDDHRIELVLFPKVLSRTPVPEPDFVLWQKELARKGVTRKLLWIEYCMQHPARHYSYNRVCQLYKRWQGADVTMRQAHTAGEKVFVDYAGHTMPIVNRMTGEVSEAQVFVATLGASNYTYVEATFSQGLRDWLGSHARAFAFFGGVPQIVVPDNLRAGVSKSCRYEPELNPAYADLATHYGVAVVPARVRKPRDKAKVEVAVQHVERWVLAPLRNQTFFNLTDLNRAMHECLVALNQRPLVKEGVSRRELFDSVERATLRALPLDRYQYAEWTKARVNIDYHIEIDKHYYSVPYRYAREQLDVRLTATTIECFHKNKRIVSHARSMQRGGHSTEHDHMPVKHQKHAEWTPERMLTWAQKTGPGCRHLAELIMHNRQHPEQAYRSVLGIIRLKEQWGPERLDAACQIAAQAGALSYKSVASILKKGLDGVPTTNAVPLTHKPIEHPNVRGATYYNQQTLKGTD